MYPKTQNYCHDFTLGLHSISMKRILCFVLAFLSLFHSRVCSWGRKRGSSREWRSRTLRVQCSVSCFRRIESQQRIFSFSLGLLAINQRRRKEKGSSWMECENGWEVVCGRLDEMKLIFSISEEPKSVREGKKRLNTRV